MESNAHISLDKVFTFPDMEAARIFAFILNTNFGFQLTPQQCYMHKFINFKAHRDLGGWIHGRYQVPLLPEDMRYRPCYPVTRDYVNSLLNLGQTDLWIALSK